MAPKPNIYEIVEAALLGTLTPDDIAGRNKRIRAMVFVAVALAAGDRFVGPQLQLKYMLQDFYELFGCGYDKYKVAAAGMRQNLYKSWLQKGAPNHGRMTILKPPPGLCELIERLGDNLPGVQAFLRRVDKIESEMLAQGKLDYLNKPLVLPKPPV